MIVERSKTALITGASTGIGAAFARQLAADGMNLILVARSDDKLKALAQELANAHQIRADVIVADLAKLEEVARVIAETRGMGSEIHLLINNAGFGTSGKFEDQDPAREQEEILLNVAALVSLTHAFLPGMLARRAGGIIQVASIAGFQPVPYMAIYGATKAFVLSFSEALWAEYRGRGVKVLALCPGPVDTPFFEIAKAHDMALGKMDTAENVVATALKAIERGKSYVIPGPISNRILTFLTRLGSRANVARLTERMMRPKAKGQG